MWAMMTKRNQGAHDDFPRSRCPEYPFSGVSTFNHTTNK
uniref:MIP06840p n=1 Tax=Drosophila melanogaster TaxID=7227 RepID=C1C3I2_DROME|nr:MIP06840p [Drosophila melanogaster]